MPKKLIFVLTSMKFVVAMATSKIVDIVDLPKFLWRMNKQILKASASRSKSSFQNFEKTLWGVAST